MATTGKVPKIGFGAGTIKYAVLLGFSPHAGATIDPEPYAILLHVVLTKALTLITLDEWATRLTTVDERDLTMRIT